MSNHQRPDRTSHENHAQADLNAARNALAAMETPGHSADAAVHTEADHDKHEAISQRAYEIYEESGRTEGRCDRNWDQADRELSQVSGKLEAEQAMVNEGGGSAAPPVHHAGDNHPVSVNDAKPISRISEQASTSYRSQQGMTRNEPSHHN